MAQSKMIRLLLPSSAHRAFLRHPLLIDAETLGTRKLVDVYLDTPDLALRRHAIELRTRKEGRRRLQTVKRTTFDLCQQRARHRWERPYDDSFDFSHIGDRQVRRWHGVNASGARPFEAKLSRTSWRYAPARRTYVSSRCTKQSHSPVTGTVRAARRFAPPFPGR